MSFTLEIRAGEKAYMSEIPGPAASDLASLEKAGYSQEVHQIVGEKETPPGQERTVSRLVLLDAINRLLSPAKSLGSGFRVRGSLSFGDRREIIGRGRAGILIDGVYFGIHCSDNYWEISPSQPIPGKSFPPELRGLYRYEPAEIKSENMGIVKVERRRGQRKELVNLLNGIKEFAQGVQSDFVTVIVG
jgi:hypothetical protein